MMRVKLSKAVKMFFGNSSLEMIYFEAIANALDANATNININIYAENYTLPATLTVSIEDNGIGFTDEKFKKFSNLFDVDETSHKGIGRLAYLCYFDKVLVESNYDKYYHRSFEFSDGFDGESSITKVNEERASNAKLSMSGYTLSKLANYNYIQPSYLKEKILEKFYPRLYKLKQAREQIAISISATIDKKEAKEVLSTQDIPELKIIKAEPPFGLLSNEIYYRIDETPMSQNKIITAISIDDRNHSVDVIAKENLPSGYNMVFLLFSDSFNGQVDITRENILLPDTYKEQIKKIFRKNIARIINQELPQIQERNKEMKKDIIDRFPHLNGYFEYEDIGYASRKDILKTAQDKFFKDQQEILEATQLDDEQYKESMELSSRALTEYILFRQIIINRLKEINRGDSESTIHNLIVPMKEQFKSGTLQNDLYRNNVWVLDDKYMTYDTVLSDEEMSDVINVITDGEKDEKDDGRPDIALIFSDNPNDEQSDKKVNVVIVELKKKGLSAELNSIVEMQLEKRARKLMQYYKNKIQQIWFYGIVEFNDEYELHLASDYHRLFSIGKVYYKEKDIVLQQTPKISFPVSMFIMDFDAVVKDADVRNSTFLNIIKNKFKVLEKDKTIE
ncbi:MAG: ATP-binding protein [Endomicrobium sp.]|jgi:hypothetical protein|nr:ATP-binding protein [Endomicrobium sp.]